MADTDHPESGGGRPRIIPQAQTLSEWRIEQIEIRLDRELKDLRNHIDKSLGETRRYLEDELKDIREHNDKRFGKIENFIIAALLFIATPVVGAMVAIVLKNPPTL